MNLVVTRVFDAPAENVWRAWSDAEMVKLWWGPTGFTCPFARIDFREGATSLVCMRASLGSAMARQTGQRGSSAPTGS